FKSFASRISVLHRQAGDVAPRTRQARDKAGAKWVICRREHDRDDRCGLLCRGDCSSRRQDDIDLAPDELGRDFGITLVTSLRPANLDRDGAILDRSRCTKPAIHWPWVEGVPPPMTPIIGSFDGCCARPASRHAAAPPPRSVMNSRLFIRSPRWRRKAASAAL